MSDSTFETWVLQLCRGPTHCWFLPQFDLADCQLNSRRPSSEDSIPPSAHIFRLGRKRSSAGESGPAVLRFSAHIRGINRMKIYVTSWFNGSNLALISIIYGNGFPIITFLSSLWLFFFIFPNVGSAAGLFNSSFKV